MKLYLFLLFNTISCKLLKKFTSNDTIFRQFLPPDEDVTIATSGDFKQFNAVFETPNPKLIKNYKKQSETKCNNFRKYNYVIVDQNYTDFKNTVTNLLNEKNLNVHGKYLVILPNLAEVVKYFALLWQNEVYNVVMQTHQGYHHTWYPYKHCGEITVRPTNLQEGFLNKIPSKLNCWLRINWSKGSIVVKNPHNDTNPGTFVLIASQLSQTMSAPFHYINSTTDFTKMLLKGEMIKFSEKMVEENTTLALGGFTFGLKLPENNDYTTFVSTMDALILLPPRKTYPKWKEFLNFSTTAIVLLVATLILNALVLHTGIGKLSLGRSFFQSYQIFVQLTLPTVPKKTHQKVYLQSILFFTMLVNSIYLGVLSGVFTKPSFENKITTVEEFLQTDVPLKCNPLHFDIVINSSVRYNYIKTKPNKIIKSFERGYDLTMEFLKNPLRAVCSTSLHLNYVRNYKNLEMIRTSSVYSIFLVRQRSHLKEKINYHIREIQERGLVQKFEQITCMFTEKKELVKGELIKTLNLDDFVGVFVLLLVGCFLSAIVFVIEKAKHF